MSLTLPSAFTESSHEENWLIKLFYDDQSATDYTPIAFKDCLVYNDSGDLTDTTNYHGCILSTSGIRDSIDLVNYTNKVSNVTFTCANFKIDGDDLSAKLYATQYINRNVEVYLRPNEQKFITDCLLIFKGRLENITHNQETVKLQVISTQPWDNLEIPNVKTARGNYFPGVYGSYAVNSSTYSSPAYATTLAKTVHPVQVDRRTWYYYYPLIHEDYGSTDTTLHYYESGVDSFLPLEDSNDAEAYESLGYVTPSKFDIKRHFKVKPDSFLGLRGWNNSANAIDGTADQDEDDSAATVDFGSSQSTSAPYSITIEKTNTAVLPSIDDPPLLASSDSSNNFGLTLEINYKVTNYYLIRNSGASIDGNDLTLKEVVSDQSFTNGTNLHENTADAIVNDGDEDANSGITISNVTATKELATQFQSTGGFPDGIQLKWIRYLKGHPDSTSLIKIVNTNNANKLSIFDIRAKLTLAIDKRNTSTDGLQRSAQVKYLYSGHDGFAKSYTGGSGTATTGLEAHRDLLKRFVGIDDSDGNVLNWSAITANRITDAWSIRYWLHKPRKLSSVLEQIQKEFRFVFKYRNDKMAYFHIKDSYSSSDVAKTLSKNDISDFSIKYTPLKGLITSITVNYEKHPALNTYMNSATDTRSTERTNYNIQTNENKVVHNLEMLVDNVSGNLNDAVNNSYIASVGHLHKDLKIIVTCNIVNNYKGYGLEAGDIILFDNSNMPSKAFNLTWTNRYFMITSISRKVGETNIEATEVS